MKNLIAIGLVLSFLAFSCGEQGSDPVQDDSAKTITSYSSLGAAVFEKSMSEDGTVVFGTRIKTLSAGEPVELIIGGERVIHEDEERPLLPAMMDGKEVYVSAYYLAAGTQLAAIKGADPVTVYSGTGLADNTAIQLLPAQIITIFPQNDEEKSSGKVRIMAYEPMVKDGSKQYFGTWNNRYLSKDALTTNQRDIETLELYQEIMEKSENLQMEPLKAMRQQYSSSIFLPLVEARILELEGAAEGGAPLPGEPEGGPVEETRAIEDIENPKQAYLWDENVRARSMPDETQDNVIGVFPMGVWGTVTQKTVLNFPIGDMDSPWFYFVPEEEIGLEGWVYGHFLDFSYSGDPSAE